MSGERFVDRVVPTLADLQPYAAGKTIAQICRERGIAAAIKLSSNENPLGCGAAALAALADPAALGLHQYPDAAAVQLREKIAAGLDVPAANIVCGNGSNDLLELCATLALRPGSKAVMSQHAFIVYRLVALSRGADLEEVPALKFGHDLEAMAQVCMEPNVGVVFVANPNNPTGSWHEPESIRRFIESVPPRVLVVLDEAYHEYADTTCGDAPSWALQTPNLVVTRTFSKIHGLAGLRIGYAIAGDELCSLLNRIRQPFNANAAAQAAAAAALDDAEHVAISRKSNAAGMIKLAEGLANLGYPTMPSQANFISFACKDPQSTFDTLLNAGIIVRMIAEYGLSGWLRATVGTEQQNEQLLAALPPAAS